VDKLFTQGRIIDMWTSSTPGIQKPSNKPASLAVPGPAWNVEFTLAIKIKDRYRARITIGRTQESRVDYIMAYRSPRREE
jgi:hypothetical protein